VPCLGRLIRPFPSSTRACGAGVASSFAVGFSSRGGRSRGRDPRRDARVFRPCSRDTGPSLGTEHACAVPEAEDSLRPSAGGAKEEPVTRARECRPANRPCSLLATQPASRNQDPDGPRAGLAPSESEPHAPSTVSNYLPDHAPTKSPDTLTEGLAPGLATACLPVAPLPRSGRSMTSSRPVALALRSASRPRTASRRSSVAPPRCLETASTTDVSRHEHPF